MGLPFPVTAAAGDTFYDCLRLCCAAAVPYSRSTVVIRALSWEAFPMLIYGPTDEHRRPLQGTLARQ
jgi:hypothetical protein